MVEGIDLRPSFRRIHEHLLNRISMGEWRPGEGMPGEHALAAEYQVSVGTMRKALDILQADGVIERQRGRGTTVRRRTLEDTYFSFFRFRNRTGQMEPPIDRLITQGKFPANAQERKAMQLAGGAMVHRVERVRLLRDVPQAVDVMSFPADRFSQFSWPIPGVQTTPYGHLERSFGVMVSFVREQLRVAKLTAIEARRLKLPRGEAVLEVLRTAYDLAGAPVEYRRTVASTARHHYLSELRQHMKPVGRSGS